MVEAQGTRGKVSSEVVVGDVRSELAAQDDKWGLQNHPSFDPGMGGVTGDVLAGAHGVISEDEARAAVEAAVEAGRLSWAHILVEEVAELFGAADDEVALRGELVQVAAVAVAWVECLDRQASGKDGGSGG